MATIGHTFIDSTNGTKYPRIKIYYGKHTKPTHISVKELRFYQNPDTKKKLKHNDKQQEILDARKHVLQEQYEQGTLNTLIQGKKVTLIEHAEWTERVKTSSSTSTMSKYASAIKHLKRFLKLEGYPLDIKLNKIDYDFCSNFKVYLESEGSSLRPNKTLSAGSQGTMFSAFKTILNEAVDRDLILKSPARNIIPNSKADVDDIGDKVWLTLKELDALEKTPTKYDMLKRMFLFQCYTGLRKGDCEKMVWSEIKKIHGADVFDIVLQKSRKKLVNILIPQAINVMPERRNDKDKVFWGFKYTDKYNIHLREWTRNAGIDKHVTSHVARHTYSINALNEFDIAMDKLAKLLGHSSVTITEDHYGAYDFKTLRKEAEKMYR